MNKSNRMEIFSRLFGKLKKVKKKPRIEIVMKKEEERRKREAKKKPGIKVMVKEKEGKLRKQEEIKGLAAGKAMPAGKGTEKVTNQDIRRVLKLMDKLLGDLPKEEIEEFAKSEDFELYKKVLERFVPEAGHEEELKEKFKDGKLTQEQIEKIDAKVRESIKKHKEDKYGVAG